MASHTARLVLLLALLAALAGRSAEGAWCVCRTDLPDATLQRTLDYACGSAADCKPIQPNAACFAPDNVKAHCSYAVNSFYQRSGQNPLACVFSGTAALSSIDPSINGCHYPASPSAPDSPPPPMAQGPNGPLKDTSGGAEQRPLLTRAEVLLPEAPQAQVFHLQPQNYSAVASGPAVASTLLVALILILMV